MFGAKSSKLAQPIVLDPLDRVAIAYLTLPLAIFLLGWLQLWAALLLSACVGYSLKPLLSKFSVTGSRLPITRLQLTVAVVVGCGWTVLGGIDHFVYTNYDWHVREAVLHDLVMSPWPVGYGLLDGRESILRAPIAFYMPAALIGKVAGLGAAHLSLLAWAAAGVTLFLLQVLSLTPARLKTALLVAATVVLFSGLDIVGNLLNVPRFITQWDSARHLEWWAGSYQYSSNTTQLFWAPSHALGGWLFIGLLFRDRPGTPLDTMFPILVVAIALWSPLAAIGVVPFLAWKVVHTVAQYGAGRIFHLRSWGPPMLVGLVIAAYLTLDAAKIHRSWEIGITGHSFDSIAMDALRLAQFFLLEAGIIGIGILILGWSSRVVLALVVLALMPLVNFGPANDFVMRSSIPSLMVLTIAACLALVSNAPAKHALAKKGFLTGLLVLGAMTPFTEFTRAIILPAWPINTEATLVGAACGLYPEHYIARLGEQLIGHLMRSIHAIPLGDLGVRACDNPSLDLYRKRIPW